MRHDEAGDISKSYFCQLCLCVSNFKKQNIDKAINRIIAKTERTIKWMNSSGLKVNQSKTEICIFHRTQTKILNININNTIITTTETMNILGISFDCNLKWNQQYGFYLF